MRRHKLISHKKNNLKKMMIQMIHNLTLEVIAMMNRHQVKNYKNLRLVGQLEKRLVRQLEMIQVMIVMIILMIKKP
jgi:hypothetical protein